MTVSIEDDSTGSRPSIRQEQNIISIRKQYVITYNQKEKDKQPICLNNMGFVINTNFLLKN